MKFTVVAGSHVEPQNPRAGTQKPSRCVAMAERNECVFCKTSLDKFVTERNRATHIGICRSKWMKIRAGEYKRPAAEPAPAPIPAKRRRNDHNEDALATQPEDAGDGMANISLNQTDIAWMRFYASRKDLSSSMIDGVLPICQLPQPTRFSSATNFFSFVDSLSGPDFVDDLFQLASVPGDEFRFAFRPLLDVVADMVQRHNGNFLDTTTETPAFEFVSGERFRRLQRNLTQATHSHDSVLCPVILSSGSSFSLFAWFCTLSLCLHC